MYTTKSFGARSATAPLEPYSFERRDPLPKDVQIEILFCGVCHSDLHTVRDEWGGTIYPCVPGHEIVGRVTKVGSEVKRFKEGDLAAVGCMVDSCRTCQSCRDGLEQYCENGMTFTYNGADKHSGGVTYGGYSESIVVTEDFVLNVSPEDGSRRDRAAALCRHHHLLADAALEGEQGTEGRHRRPGRARAHGGEVRPRLWRECGALHDLARARRRTRCGWARTRW